MKQLVFLTAVIFFNCSIMAQRIDFSVTDFGAVTDGKTTVTAAIQASIDACAKNGGGRVVVPPGVFIIGTIHLKSNVHFFLRKEASCAAVQTWVIMKPMCRTNLLIPCTRE